MKSESVEVYVCMESPERGLPQLWFNFDGPTPRFWVLLAKLYSLLVVHMWIVGSAVGNAQVSCCSLCVTIGKLQMLLIHLGTQGETTCLKPRGTCDFLLSLRLCLQIVLLVN